MIRPQAHIGVPCFNILGLAELDGVEELEKLIAESEKHLFPCPCCGRENPCILYGYDPVLPDWPQKHRFYIECPGDPMHTWPDNPKADGCGARSGLLLATEDEDLADFKEAIRYITEAWNRRS